MTAATRDDVVFCYRTLLEREPESEAAIESHLVYKRNLSELVRVFLASSEFVSRTTGGRINETAGGANFYYSADPHIDVDATEDELRWLLARVTDTCTRLGEEAPHWSVLGRPEYQRERMTPEIEDAFYETGREDVAAFLSIWKRNRITPNFSGTVVDLGCGVGRLGVHLSEMFRKYVGVDVSAPHLAVARDRLNRIGRSNAEFALLPEFLSRSETFDVFVSLIALQHNPPPVIVHLLHKILARLNRGGIALFQLPCLLYDYEFKLSEYLKSRKEDTEYEWHAAPQRMVFEILARHDCKPIEVIYDGKASSKGISYTFVAQKSE